MNPDGLPARSGRWLFGPSGLVVLGVVAMVAAATFAIGRKRYEAATAPASAEAVDPLLTPMVELVPVGLHGEPAYVRDQRTGRCFITFPSDGYHTGYSWVPCDGLPGVPPGGPPERTTP